MRTVPVGTGSVGTGVGAVSASMGCNGDVVTCATCPGINVGAGQVNVGVTVASFLVGDASGFKEGRLVAVAAAAVLVGATVLSWVAVTTVPVTASVLSSVGASRGLLKGSGVLVTPGVIVGDCGPRVGGVARSGVGVTVPEPAKTNVPVGVGVKVSVGVGSTRLVGVAVGYGVLVGLGVLVGREVDVGVAYLTVIVSFFSTSPHWLCASSVNTVVWYRVTVFWLTPSTPMPSR